MLCLSDGPKPKRTCSKRATFDVWSHHPYTSRWSDSRGGPQEADISLGDLAEMRRVLARRSASGRIRSSGPVRFWVTEFSWDSNPPDPKGVPIDAPCALGGGGALPHVARRRRASSPGSSCATSRSPTSLRSRASTLLRGRPRLRPRRSSPPGVPLPVRRAPTDASPGALLGPNADERGGHRDRGALGRGRVETSGSRPGGIVRDLHRHLRLDPPNRLGPGSDRRRRGFGPVLPPRAARPGRVPVRLVLS